MRLKYCTSRVPVTGALFLALSAMMSSGADYQSTVLSQGPVGYWRLNETTQPQPSSGLVSEGSVANPGGTFLGFPRFGVPGPFAGSQAVGLDGATGQYLSTPHQPALNTKPFSLELWVKPAVIPKFAYVAASMQVPNPRSGWYLAQDDGSTFGVGSAFVVRLFNGTNTTQTTQLAVPVTSTDWMHLVLTHDGTTAALYANGALVTNRAAFFAPAVGPQPFTLGCRSDLSFNWPGQLAEVAMYGSALSEAQVAAHYNAATATPANYATVVKADAPTLYYRFKETVYPPAANLGTLGATGNAAWIHPAQAATPAPVPPTYPGFDAGNTAATFATAGSTVRVPALNMNTNTVTISAWVKASGNQPVGAGLVTCRSSTTASGLTIDQVYGGLGIGYIWDGNAYGWSPSADLGFPSLPDGDWAYVALTVEQGQAALFICDRNNANNFTGVTNSFNVSHATEPFDGATLIGTDGSDSATKSFAGSIDEVAIFNRALSAGELFTQYASAVGGVGPKLFADLQGPLDSIPAGDPLVLKVDAGGTPPLTYTWKRGATTVATTTSGVLTIASATLGDSGTYEVTVSNASGSKTSQPVPVTVVTPSAPTIVELKGFQNRTLYPGAALMMSVVATGGGLKYQWFKNSSAIGSATTSSYTINSVTNADAGTYSVTVTNALGSVSPANPAVITVPAPAAGSYEALMVTAKPEAWWRLDEAAGATNMFDAMGRHDGYYTNLNGTVPPVTLGSPGALSGDANTAATFSPTTKGVGVVPFSPALAPSRFTMEVWAKTTVLNGSLVPLSNTDGTGGNWWQTSGGNWEGYGPSGRAPLADYNPAVAIASGQWSHLVVMYDSTRLINGTAYPYVYYVNGQTDGYVWTGSGANVKGPLIIGGRYVEGAFADRFFDGQVDEVAVYGRALTEAEIKSHFEGRFGNSTAPYFIGSFIPQTVTTGKRINFNTIVQGSVPITLQWYKNSSPIPGATTTSYTITNTAIGDTATYTLWATNAAGVSSQSASVNVIQPVGYANVTNDLVMHLRFDGNANDSSGRGNNGTAIGNIAYVPGAIGGTAAEYATLTNGLATPAIDSTSYITLANPADLQFGSAASFTIGLWVKLPVDWQGGDLPFIGIATNSMNNPGWAVGPTYETGGWQWCLNDGVNNIDVNGAANSINSGGWHHLVLSVDRSTKIASTYLDGVCVARTDISQLGNIDNNNVWPVTIGQDPTGTYLEDGTAILDDLGVWRRALTALEVAQIASAGAAGRSFDTVNPTPDVAITVTRNGSSVTLAWPTGTLLESESLGSSASWSAVPGAAAPSYTFTPGPGNRYFRVQVQ